MNWTEGNLARHSRASKGREVLLRQKAHFAKARAGLLNANVKISPPSISAFAHSVRSSPARSHSARSKLSATSPFQKRNRYKSPLQVSHYFRHDNSHEVPTPPDVQKDQAEVEALRQKRRKLLLKGDWTGIKLQKPIEMEFSKPRASVGGPWNHSMSRHAKSKSRMRHWLDTEYNGGQGRGPRSVVKMTAHISPNQLRVRVGSRERFFGDSSNVSPRSRTCRDIDSSPYVPRHSGSRYNERRPPRAYKDCGSATDAERASPQLPELHQPLPHRSFLPGLFHLQPIDADDAASTKAQVGVLEPTIPLSRVAENEEWLNFVGGADRDPSRSDFQPSYSQAAVVQREISPGVSQFGVSQTIDSPDTAIGSVEVPLAAHAELDFLPVPPVPTQDSLLKPCELEVAVGEVSQGNDSGSSADEASSSSMEASRPRSKQISKTAKEEAPTKQPGLRVDSDEISMQALHASCSPTSDNFLSQSHKDNDFRNSVNCSFESPILAQREQQDAAMDHEQLSQPRSMKEDESDIRETFVLADYDKSFNEAFEKARKETARNLRPSDSSTINAEDENREHNVPYPEPPKITAAFKSGHSLDIPSFVDEYDSAFADISTMTSVSHLATVGEALPSLHSTPIQLCSDTKATAGDSSPDPLSVPNPINSDTTLRTGEATVCSSSSSKDAMLSLVDGFLSRSDARSLARSEENIRSLVALPSSVSEQSEADDIFKFARSKPFLGKKIHMDEQRQIALSEPQIRGKVTTWRRQKRAGNGRASIRALPNFSSDPIEEVEDILAIKGAQKQSLFGPLDTEEA